MALEMQYKTRAQYAIICRSCGTRGPWAMSRKGACKRAKEEGWRVSNRSAVCPYCLRDDEELNARARAMKSLERNSLLREALDYVLSLPGDTCVRGPVEIDGLPRFVLYYAYLAQHGEADYRYPGGVVVFEVRKDERVLFSALNWAGAVALWQEGGRWEYRTGYSVMEAAYGRLP